MSSYAFTVTNNLQRDLTIERSNLSTGRWTTRPPHKLAAGASVEFAAEADEDDRPQGELVIKIQELDGEDGTIRVTLSPSGVHDRTPIWVRSEYTYTSTNGTFTHHVLTFESNQ